MSQEWLKYLSFPEFGYIKYKRSTVACRQIVIPERVLNY